MASDQQGPHGKMEGGVDSPVKRYFLAASIILFRKLPYNNRQLYVKSNPVLETTILVAVAGCVLLASCRMKSLSHGVLW